MLISLLIVMDYWKKNFYLNKIIILAEIILIYYLNNNVSAKKIILNFYLIFTNLISLQK